MVFELCKLTDRLILITIHFARTVE